MQISYAKIGSLITAATLVQKNVMAFCVHDAQDDDKLGNWLK